MSSRKFLPHARAEEQSGMSPRILVVALCPYNQANRQPQSLSPVPIADIKEIGDG
jgi:hypothetical protein